MLRWHPFFPLTQLFACGTALPDPNAQAHCCIPMKARHPLDGADAGPFGQHRNGQDFLFKWQIAQPERIRMRQPVCSRPSASVSSHLCRSQSSA